MGRNDGIDEREDHDRELESDELLHLVANAAFDSLDPGDPANDPFFEWFVDHARARRSDTEKRADARLATEFGRRMAMRWAERSLGVAARGSGPALHAPPVNASVAAALDIMPIATRAPHLDMAVAAGAGRELWDEECTEWAEIPAGIPVGRHLALRVAGDSMTPFFHPGDTVLVRLGDTVAAGSVIVARLPDDGYVVKRVGRATRYEIDLVSLNPSYAPVTLTREPGLVLGTVVLRWCNHGRET